MIPVMLAFVLAATGCNKADDDGGSSTNVYTPAVNNSTDESKGSDSSTETASDNRSESTNTESSDNDQAETGTLRVSFGDSGSPFTLHLYDNDTAAAIARHVGTAEWRLPIYHYDDYENWEVMQYYDIPSRYEIPSAAESISSEKAGEVYYSEPNRIVLFFGDAQVSGKYTKVGYFDYSEEFRTAVENNPVLEGWGNKIVIIQPGD
ncbi:MAG: hypothetical protein K2N38_02395 [Oscillospiraceae bacterium]|nr:hypothetical protein [Oscillospiraceae bacterium]